MNMNILRNARQINQNGFASMVIAIVLVLVLSLMTVGFAELMRSEQKSATDRHLSNQAYYAAETGINDAAKAVNEGFNKVKSKCGPLLPADGLDIYNAPGAKHIRDSASNQVGDDEGIVYSCLLINPIPKDLDYGDIGQVKPKYVTLTGIDIDTNEVVPITNLLFSWKKTNGETGFISGPRNFKTAQQWGSATGVLRVSITPLVGGHIDRQYLMRNTYTAFLYPNDSNSSFDASGDNLPASIPASATSLFDSSSNVSPTGPGAIVNGNCNENSLPNYCNTMITGLSHHTLLINMRSIYSDSIVKITAYGGSSNKRVGIRNAQTVVDATGKAQDVVRRVQVRIPSDNGYDVSAYSLEVGSNICKQLEIYPNSATANCTP
jgi:hypothetical protein